MAIRPLRLADNWRMDWTLRGPRNGNFMMERGINVIALVKDAERYIFLYDHESAPALMQTLGRFAGNPELSFSWYDAAVLSQKVRRLNRETADEQEAEFRAPRASR